MGAFQSGRGTRIPVHNKHPGGEADPLKWRPKGAESRQTEHQHQRRPPLIPTVRNSVDRSTVVLQLSCARFPENSAQSVTFGTQMAMMSAASAYLRFIVWYPSIVLPFLALSLPWSHPATSHFMRRTTACFPAQNSMSFWVHRRGGRGDRWVKVHCVSQLWPRSSLLNILDCNCRFFTSILLP